MNGSQQRIELGVAQLNKVESAEATGGGRKGAAKFTIMQHDAALLMDALGQHSYEVNFAGATLGNGLTIGGVAGKPDDEGNPASTMWLSAPQSAIRSLAKAMELVGKRGSLTLVEEQLSLDLTARAT